MKGIVESFIDSLKTSDCISAVARLKRYWMRRDLTDGQYEIMLNACDKVFGVEATVKAAERINSMVESLLTDII